MNNWSSLKNKIYYEDGSLRDIYIFDTNKEDWKVWSELVNEKFEVEFYYGRTQKFKDKIEIDELLRYFTAPEEFKDVNKAVIKLGNASVICYLHFEAEMEADIDPKQVRTIEDHDAILKYLQAAAGALQKKVILTSEMTKEDVLLEVKS